MQCRARDAKNGHGDTRQSGTRHDWGSDPALTLDVHLGALPPVCPTLSWTRNGEEGVLLRGAVVGNGVNNVLPRGGVTEFCTHFFLSFFFNFFFYKNVSKLNFDAIPDKK